MILDNIDLKNLKIKKCYFVEKVIHYNDKKKYNNKLNLINTIYN